MFPSAVPETNGSQVGKIGDGIWDFEREIGRIVNKIKFFS